MEPLAKNGKGSHLGLGAATGAVQEPNYKVIYPQYYVKFHTIQRKHLQFSNFYVN